MDGVQGNWVCLSRAGKNQERMPPKGNGSRKRDTKIDKEELINIGVPSRDMGDSGRSPQETILICCQGGPWKKSWSTPNKIEMLE